MKNTTKTKDKEKIRQNGVMTARYITHVAVMAGLITALKFALSFLPNIELITLFIAVFSAVWGLKYSLPAPAVFCLVEMAIYGIGSWVVLYFIYWPLLAVIFHFALRGKKPPVAMGIAVAIAVPMTVFFGVLSACTDTLFVVGAVSPDMLDTYFVSYYLKGLWFDLLHLVSVVASILLLYIPLVKICEKIKVGINPTKADDDIEDGNLFGETDQNIVADNNVDARSEENIDFETKNTTEKIAENESNLSDEQDDNCSQGDICPESQGEK